VILALFSSLGKRYTE